MKIFLRKMAVNSIFIISFTLLMFLYSVPLIYFVSKPTYFSMAAGAIYIFLTAAFGMTVWSMILKNHRSSLDLFTEQVTHFEETGSFK